MNKSRKRPVLFIVSITLIILAAFQNFSNVPNGTDSQSLHGAGSIGVYIMGGRFKNLSVMREHLKSFGINSVRLLISNDPIKMMNMYGLDTSDCREVACIVAKPEVAAFLADDAFRSIAFTTYDYAIGDGSLLDYERLNAKRDSVLGEYSRFFTEIAKRASKNKLIVIANWEGDNQAFCGRSYEFANSTLKSRAADCPSAEKNIWSLAAWFNLRQLALENFRRTTSLTFRMVHAVEFNSIRHLQAQDITSILQLIANGQIKCDWASYSSYESLNDNRLAEDLRYLKSLLNSKPLMVGEFGYSFRNNLNPSKRLVDSIKVLQDFRTEVPLSFIWQAYEDSSVEDNGYALFKSDGSAQMMIDGKALAFPRIRAVHFVGTDRTAVELYGQFPSFQGSMVYSSCAGIDRQVTVTFAGPTQINIALPANSKACRFRVISSQGIADDWTGFY